LQGFEVRFAAGAQGEHGLAAFLLLAELAFLAFGAHGFAYALLAANGAAAISPPIAVIAPSVCRDFFSDVMWHPPTVEHRRGLQNRVVTVTSPSGMALVSEVPTALSKPG
jgi:hypothetical protein